ncbi:hypothetical protein CPB83DRAFT_768758 [Crepidotus variabilis]|uniref:Uncharacterized protein n=1 Tax=Crepidotus variabilis TaxID=179855 RepID=A0A9P6JNL9_9AGAR|nr:hypothetical protein CPB83DRAFT_768758 [Crepidotus variabilis]
MRFSTLLSASLLFAATVTGAPIVETLEELEERASVDFFKPTDKGGSLLDQSAGLGEPLNVIISGKSSPEVLTKDGFNNYARAVGYSIECFGQHRGDPQKANLGDGHGYSNEIEVLREHFSIPVLGTCLESLKGGNHLRMWQQNGPDANSGALFLAVSQEEDIIEHHDIVPDGYNIGRDRFVDGALGTKVFLWKKYTTTVVERRDLIVAAAEGVNHGISQDGVVKVLTVTVKNVWE